MKKTFLKLTSVFICVALFLSLSIPAAAATYTTSSFNEKLEEVKKLYPDGSRQYEWKVNGTVVGWECHGYARWLSFYIWGTDFANGAGKGWVRYNSTATTTAIDKLVPGDVLRYRTSATKNSNHSIFVTAIVGDTVYFTDCNIDGASTIKWNRSTTKANLEAHLKMELAERDYVEYGYIAHFTENTLSENGILHLSYNANGGKLNLPTQTITSYTVSDPKGINMRSGAGTSFNKVAALPKGTVFTVTETKTDAKGTYLWGKTTYNSVTGWCVISENWTTKTEIKIPPDYTLSNDESIIKTSDNTPFVQDFLFGVEYKEGLARPESFGHQREGYQFLGWSAVRNGEIILNPNNPFTPAVLFPNGNKEINSATLYAVWKSNTAVTLKGIEISALPTKTHYRLSTPFNQNGLKIALKYSDNTEKIITEGFNISGFDSSAAGEKTITVAYEGRVATFTVLVVNLKAGDINNDNSINLLDLSALAQAVAGWEVECDKDALDLTADSLTNIDDITLLAQFIAGWDGAVLK